MYILRGKELRELRTFFGIRLNVAYSLPFITQGKGRWYMGSGVSTGGSHVSWILAHTRTKVKRWLLVKDALTSCPGVMPPLQSQLVVSLCLSRDSAL